ncbi:MAG TPA: hypothetical protein VET66_12210 [Steroidobacteraceae bacterium]|nr:hypothetical protein [Steroidobacteraceae bacterium]
MRVTTLGRLVVLYGAASLLHFAHNAEYLAHYPNLPPSWTRAEVYLAWAVVTVPGVLGFALYRHGRRRSALALLALYALLGFAGLLHYSRAPWSHHGLAMNLTIALEVASAACLLLHVARLAVRERSAGP